MTKPRRKDPRADRAYFSAREVCSYTGLSLRTVRKLLALQVDPMPSIKVEGSVLIPIVRLDDWLERRATTPTRDAVAAKVDEFMAEIGRG